jgi:hypothetical protein
VIGSLWQRDCYDRIECKTNDAARRMAGYILQNPVKAGLAARWEEHPYTKLVREP